MRRCREIQRWITENISRPVENWLNQEERRCRIEPCNWWCLCCNKWFCWIVVVVVRVVTWIVEAVTRLVTEVVCTIVSLALDFAAFLFNLILSIPIIGGILRTIFNWLNEIFWRIISFPDFAMSLMGVRLKKKMRLKLIILNQNGVPHTTEAAALRGIQTAQNIFNTRCNVELIYTGVCTPQISTPSEANNIECGTGGFFSDWWIGGSYLELVSSDCLFKGGFKRIIGYGSDIITFVIASVDPTTKVGCSFAATHDYVLIEPNIAGIQSVAHEICHACLLDHDELDSSNLMFPSIRLDGSGNLINQRLSNYQIAVLRSSRHCTFI